ncbi:hypothetical protein LWI29_003245 [Acer saccharum]|uniref:non-specific serine/threonine protein kinase n=1 Tax=Acer saccharum TaxID=4024 RepID=A0AA39VY57_ACESA|nr:hypothetical protein LWI29_003245 [Acer saccharum]
MAIGITVINSQPFDFKYIAADALSTLISNLGLNPAPTITGGFCGDDQSLGSITINCNCSTNINGSVCHITEIIMDSAGLSGVIDGCVAELAYLKTLDLSDNKIHDNIPSEIGNLTNLITLDLSGNQLNGPIPESMGNLSKLKTLFLDMNLLSERIPQSLGNLSSLQYLTNIFMDERCPDKKFHSLYINAGGEETTIDKRHYDADHNTSLFYVSPNHWAYSCSGDFLSSSSNSSDYIKNMTCGVASVDAPLYEKARLCPQALTYYGFCLQNGNYHVTLHFAETVYAKDEDHSSSGKRVFDIYIQGKRVRKDYNIKERAGGPNKICNEYLNATVSDHTLEIRLFWAGKGSMYNPPSLNGPLISAISVTPDFKVGGLPFAIIVVITVAAIFIPLLLLAFMWTMGWVGHKEWRETRVQLRGKSYTVKQVVDATHNFSSEMEIGRGQFGRVYKAELPDQTVAVKKLSPQSKQIEEMCNHSSSDSDPQEEYSPLSVEEYLPEPVEDHSPSSDDFDPQEEYSPLSVEEYLPQPVEDHSPSSDDFDPQEEYSPLSVEEYLPQPVEDHSPSSNDFDPQEENSQLLVEEFLPPLVEDDSPLLDNFNPQEVYSPMSVEEYSPLLDEMPIEENTIEQYTPGTFEEDESQQSPRIEMDAEYIEGYRNYEKLLAEFVNKLEGHQMDFNTSFYEQLLSFGDLIVSEWPWSDGGIESIWKEITHALLKVLPEELRQHNYVTLTLMEADVITTFSEALEIILDYDDHRVRRNLRKHAVSSMGPDLKTQKRYDRKAGWYINNAFKNYLVEQKYYLPPDDKQSINAHFERIMHEIPESFRIID